MFLELLLAEREAAGLTQTYVSNCERGERRIDTIEAGIFCIPIGLQYPTFAAKIDAAIEREAAAKKQATRR